MKEKVKSMMSRKNIMIILLNVLLVVFSYFYTIQWLFPKLVSPRMKIYFAIIYVLMFVIITAFSLIIITNKKVAYEKMAVFFIISWGVVMGLALPCYSSVDEYIHFVSAYQVSNYILGTESDANDIVMMRDCDVLPQCDEDKLEMQTLSVRWYKVMAEGGYLHENDFDMIEGAYASQSVYICPWYKYIPAGLGIALARIMQLGPIGLHFMGRLFNLLFFALVCYWAISITPYGKVQIISFALTPLMLELYSSYSYDTISNALVILFLAMCLRLACNKKDICWYDLLLLLVIYIWLLPFKAIYIGCIFFVFLIPIMRFNSIKEWKGEQQDFGEKEKKRRLLLVIVGVVIALVAIIVIVRKTAALSTMFLNTRQIYVPGYGYVESYSLKDVVMNPKLACYTIWTTINNQINGWILVLFGNTLGTMGIQTATLCVYGFILTTMYCTLSTGGNRAPRQVRWVASFVIFTIFVAALLGALVGWTPYGNTNIWGITGRYFLPILSVFMICFSTDETYSEKHLMAIYIQNILLAIVIQSCFWITMGA